ncbi:MAG: sensor histidine kinase, partial [Candidatus Thorarchaeota archaeon]
YSSILNHDFANDIMVILNQIEVAEMMGLNEERLIDIKDTSKASAERMTQVLTLFKAQEGEAEQNIVRLLKQITAEAKTAYPDLEIKLQTIPSVLNSRISAGRLLSMVFFNLLRNSNEYGGDATKVNFAVTMSGKDIVITYSDNGPGIDKSIASKLFQRGASTTGGGLGLYLSRKVIESYEGSMKLISGKKSQKQGAVFEIKLPLT